MAENLGEATLVLSTDAAKLSEGLFQAQSLAERTAQQFDSLASGIKSAFAFAGISIGLKEVFDATVAQERADRLLENAVRATGQAAGFTAEQLKAQAAALQDTTTFSDDAIQSVQTQLLKFRNVQGEVFRDATKSILDFAASTGGDATEAVKMLGFALNNPVEGLNRLKRAGIDVNFALEEQVKNLINLGKVTEAQQVILDEFQKTVGGSAEAMRNTLGGSLTALRNKFEDTFLEIKGPIVGQLTAAINIITSNLGTMSQIFNAVFAAIKSVVEDAMQIVFGFLDGIGKMIAGDWRSAMESFKLSGESINIVGRAATAAQEAFKKTGEEITALEAKNASLAASAPRTGAASKIVSEEAKRAMQEAIAAAQQASDTARLAQQEALILGTSTAMEQAALAKEAADKAATASREAVAAATSGMTEAAIEARNKTKDAAGAAADNFKSIQAEARRMEAAMASVKAQTASTAGAITAAWATGAITFNQFVESMIQQIIKLIAQMIILKTIAPGAGQSFGLGFVGGLFRAEGGPVFPGIPTIVGEQGPEMFIPDSPGTIVPNDQLGMGGVTVTQSFNVSGVDFSEESAARKMMSQMAAQMRQGVIEAVQLANATGDASILNSARAV
jgi:hypothetical protein